MTLYKIQANASGTRSIEVSDKDLLELCLDVIYNNNMKALGLANLVALYKEWESKPKEETEE